MNEFLLLHKMTGHLKRQKKFVRLGYSHVMNMYRVTVNDKNKMRIHFI